MLSPKKSPRAVFCCQMKLKIANGDIGEAHRDPCHNMMLHKNNVTRRSKALFKLSALYFTKSTMAAFTTNRNFLEWQKLLCLS